MCWRSNHFPVVLRALVRHPQLFVVTVDAVDAQVRFGEQEVHGNFADRALEAANVVRRIAGGDRVVEDRTVAHLAPMRAILANGGRAGGRERVGAKPSSTPCTVEACDVEEVLTDGTKNVSFVLLRGK